MFFVSTSYAHGIENNNNYAHWVQICFTTNGFSKATTVAPYFYANAVAQIHQSSIQSTVWKPLL